MEDKVGKAGGMVQIEIGVEVVVERLVVEVVVEQLVVGIGNEVGEVLQLQGWKVRWRVGGKVVGVAGKLVGELRDVKLVWKSQGVWEGSVNCRQGREVGRVPELRKRWRGVGERTGCVGS